MYDTLRIILGRQNKWPDIHTPYSTSTVCDALTTPPLLMYKFMAYYYQLKIFSLSWSLT